MVGSLVPQFLESNRGALTEHCNLLDCGFLICKAGGQTNLYCLNWMLKLRPKLIKREYNYKLKVQSFVTPETFEMCDICM